MIREVVWIGHDHYPVLVIKEKGVAQDLDDLGINRVAMVLSGGTVIDSNVAGQEACFDWVTDADKGHIICDFSDEDLTAGEYTADVVLFDPNHPQGIPWGQVQVVVKPNIIT